MIIDGIDPEYVKDVATILIKSENHIGHALLERKIITEGVLSIQRGEHPRALEPKLLAYLGEEYLKKRGFCCLSESEYPVVVRKLRVRIASVAGKSPLPECVAFDNTILALSHNDLQQVILETDRCCLAVALKGCGEAVAKKIDSNIALRLGAMIVEDMEYMDSAGVSEILEEQCKIMNIINRLAEVGAIVLSEELELE